MKTAPQISGEIYWRSAPLREPWKWGLDERICLEFSSKEALCQTKEVRIHLQIIPFKVTYHSSIILC